MPNIPLFHLLSCERLLFVFILRDCKLKKNIYLEFGLLIEQNKQLKISPWTSVYRL